MAKIVRRKFVAAILGLGAAAAGVWVLVRQLGKARGVNVDTDQGYKKIVKGLSPKEHHWVGDGFYVSTIFSVFDVPYQLITPFVLMDHAEPKYFPPTEKKLGVGEHPHRGFETVTFAIEGEVEHRDSGGGGGVITTGGVQWMTAASGVVHDEFHSREFAKRGGEFSMVQLWVNLPAKDKMTTPRYQSLAPEDFKTFSLQDGQAHVTLIAGEFMEEKGPAKTHTPMNIYRLKSKAEIDQSLSFEEGTTTLLFVLKGRMEIDGQRFHSRDLAIMSRVGKLIDIKLAEDTELLVLNGSPIDEPIVHYGPFVMNTKEEIQEAMMDFQAGKMGTLVSEEGS